MAIDVTDATFQTEVVERSMQSVVIVDLWAPWCGPCKTLSPIIETVVDGTNGKAVLAKVDIDENPAIAQAFRAQSIPAVYALKDGQVVDGFIGALPEHEVRQFVERLLPTAEDDPANEDAIVGLAELLIARGETEEALALVARIPESDRTRRVAAKARLGVVTDDHDATLTGLLEKVKDDDDARQQYVDILELMGPEDPRTAKYRKLLTQRLF